MYHYNHLWETAMTDLDNDVGRKLWELSENLIELEKDATNNNKNNDRENQRVSVSGSMA
jgi:hypothetical protein